MKNNAKEKQLTSITDLNNMFTDLWVDMSLDYFIKLAESMLNRLQNNIKTKGHMTIILIVYLVWNKCIFLPFLHYEDFSFGHCISLSK